MIYWWEGSDGGGGGGDDVDVTWTQHDCTRLGTKANLMDFGFDVDDDVDDGAHSILHLVVKGEAFMSLLHPNVIITSNE